MLKGSCLCGEVTYLVEEPLEHFTHCHCSMCRKVHGTPFGSYVRSSGVTFKSGEEHIGRYESSPGFSRCFCDKCGSVVPESLDDEDFNFVPAGGLDSDVPAVAQSHIFVGSKAHWHTITDELPQSNDYGSSAAPAPVEQQDRSGADGDYVHGSCLCNKVKYRYRQGSAKLMMLCHCSRCRKVKGAAHASNVFVTPEDFEWLAGEDQLTVYDLPQAERFGNSFCNSCGSSMPRQSSNAPMVNVPAGALDDEPGIEPKAHIFVGSKSNWYEITDQIPQHDEMPG